MMILYRGPLASCNYDCPYCPFGKRRDTPEQLRTDRAALDRFADWVSVNPDRHALNILFTPWGEGLTRSWYRDTMTRLSHLPHVGRIAIQTNLSCRLDWLSAADVSTVALWATYHPGEVSRSAFLAKCAELDRLGVRYSVGVVGLPEHHDEARALRDELPESVYLWVNAAEGLSYDASAEAAWTAIDPLFGYSVRPHESSGHECRAGESAISVQGDGTVRRCHFIPEPIGNLYDGSYLDGLRPRPCTNQICDCHIGYVHLKRLPLYDVFAGGILERIPAWGVPAAATTVSPPRPASPRPRPLLSLRPVR